MIDTIARTRLETRRTRAVAAPIREACLIGSPGRTYVHLGPAVARPGDPAGRRPASGGRTTRAES